MSFSQLSLSYKCIAVFATFHKAFRNDAYPFACWIYGFAPTAFPFTPLYRDKVPTEILQIYSVVMQRWMGIFLIVAFVFFWDICFRKPFGTAIRILMQFIPFYHCPARLSAPSGVGDLIFYGSFVCLLSCNYALLLYILPCIFALSGVSMFYTSRQNKCWQSNPCFF